MPDPAVREGAFARTGSASDAERRYGMLFDSIDEGFCICEMLFDGGGVPSDYRFLEVNPRFAEMTGIAPDAIGRTARELVPGLEDWWMETYGRVVITGEPARFEHGSEAMGRFFDVFVAPVGPREEAQFGIVFRDITAQRQAEAALRATESRLEGELDDSRLLQSISSQYINGGGIEAMCTSLMDAAVSLMHADFGSMQVRSGDGSDLRLLTWRGFHDDAAASWEHVDYGSASTCGKALEGSRIIAPDVDQCDYMQGTRDLEMYRLSGIRAVQSTPLISHTGEVVGMISTHWREPHQPDAHELELLDIVARQAADLLAQRQAVARLTASEERARLAIEAAQIGTWTFDVAAQTATMDDRMCEIWGRPRDERVLSLERALNYIHEDDRQAVALAIAAALNGESNGVYDAEFRIIRDDGSERWIAANGQATFEMRDGAPAATRFIGTGIDITDRKRAELELRRAVTAKDDFLGLVSHELRTPITTILGNAEVLVRTGDMLASEDRHGALHDIHENAHRLNRIIADLLTLARAERGMLEPEPLELARAVLAVAAGYERDAHVPVQVTGSDTRAIVVGEMGVVSQVLGNFLSNAAKYGAGSKIEMAIGRDETEAHVRVLDRGIGLNPDEADRLFDSFYRSEEAGRVGGGLGIGLSVCKTLAEAIGGRVWAAPREGGGAEFGFALPLYEVDAAIDA